MIVRHQRGYVYKVGKGQRASFHVRFYQTELVDGKPTRVQRSKLLCMADDLHYSKTCKPVKELADKFMAKINEESGVVVAADDMRVVDFWDKEYLPYCQKEYKGRGMKPISLKVRKQLWNSLLRDHFADYTLRQYQPQMARAYLNSLKTAKSESTLRHVRALASAVFTEAINRDKLKGIEINPWKIKLPTDSRESAPTRRYTLEETENIISALVDRVDCQLVMALACWTGLRPGEIRGLQWGDIDRDWIHIRRAVDELGNITTPKTAGSVGDVPLLDAVRVPLELWRKKCGSKKGLWVLSTTDKPIVLSNLVNRVIIPTLKGAQTRALESGDVHLAATLEWKTLYSGRRGAGTMAVASGNPKLAQTLLRHENLSTTLKYYDKDMPKSDYLEQMRAVHAKRLKS